ncbi:MAG TPA: hypothetical protein VM689_10660 [Aliidongia sp.]|nr:hypothetical protein [Aliidongia sp.]
MIITLVMTYCLATGAECHDERPLLPEQEMNMTLMGCSIIGQQIGAQYVVEHPSWQVKSYRCEIDKPKSENT